MSSANGTIRIGAFSVDLGQVLGKGASGFVYKGHHIDTYEPVAVKAIQMSQVNNEVTQYLLEGQKRAMRAIKSPYIVKTYDIIQQKDYCYIVMELCSNGTLKELIQRKGHLEPTEAIKIFKNLVIGYTAIVEALFIHRDLKTANILIRSNGDPVIIDFGYCEMIMGQRPMIQYNVGSPSYMSPQAHSKSRYSEKSDIWSLGVILNEMLTGKTLDNGLNIKEFFNIVQKEGAVRLKLQLMSPVCKQLLLQSLEVNPEKRATIHKLKYTIDKSLIPQMQAQLKKAHSNTDSSTSAGSNQDLKFVPNAHFNYGPRRESKEKQKKQKIVEHLRMLRGTDQFSCNSQKIIQCSQIGSTANERNQQSLLHLYTQNTPPPQFQTIVRKSLQKRDDLQRIMMKKVPSVKDVQLKPSMKKIPAFHKAISAPQQYVHGPIRSTLTSIRMV